MTKEQAEVSTILRVTVGSTAHGLGMNDMLDDRDEMGICIEPIEYAIGVSAPFEQIVWRSAAIREGKQDAPSQSGDLDLTIYSLRKYLRLALKGNPTVLTALFASNPLIIDAYGDELRKLAPQIVSRQAGRAFLGYLQAQRQRLLGERGNGGHGKPRHELIEKFGFDTKYAMHMLRLGFQGVELLQTGHMSMPMREPERGYLRDLRNGKHSEQEALTMAGELEQELKDLLLLSPLAEYPNTTAVDSWMIRTYFDSWANAVLHE